ncbi:hypothetical protein AAVH_27755 [Aphelenchoides avenae]|nr:hypothetical protein AAVH_27755 [Aphelenchus avenae]
MIFKELKSEYLRAGCVWNDLKNGVEANEIYFWTSRKFGYETGCNWPAGMRPRPKKGVDKYSVIYEDAFHGRWEDGEGYKKTVGRHLVIRPVARDASPGNRLYYEGEDDGSSSNILGDTQLSPGEWTDCWCWTKIRGFICERRAIQPSSHDEL